MKRNHKNWSCNYQLPVATYKGHKFAYGCLYGELYWVEEAMVEFSNGTFIDWDEISQPSDITAADIKKIRTNKKYFRQW